MEAGRPSPGWGPGGRSQFRGRHRAPPGLRIRGEIRGDAQLASGLRRQKPGQTRESGPMGHAGHRPHCQLLGGDGACQAEAEPRPRPRSAACRNANKFCLQTVAGVRVCMCVFNSGMNLILIPPTLGMGNSCLNELNSGFKIASICSPSEPAPSEATLRLGARSSGSWSQLWGRHSTWGRRVQGACSKPALPLGKLPPPPPTPGISTLHL